MPALPPGSRVALRLLGLVFLVWSAALTAGEAPPTVATPPGHDAEALEPHLRVLHDASGRLGLDEVRNAAARGAFSRLPAQGANYGYIDGTVWLRFRVRAGTSGRYIVEIPYAHLDRVVLHVPDAPNAAQRVQAAGDSRPFVERPIRYRMPAFPLDLAAGESVTAYLEVASSGAVQIPARLWREADFQAATRHAAYFYGPYYGVLLAMVVYNLWSFMLIRDRDYLYYVAAITAIGAFVFAYTGMAFQFVWPHAPAWNQIAILLFAALANLTVAQFTRSLLQLRAELPRVDAGFQGIVALSGVAAAATPVLPYALLVVATTALLLVTIVAILSVAGICWARGSRQGRYFVLAWGILLVGAMITALSLEGWVPPHAVTRHAIPVGSAIEMIILAIALADRARLLQQRAERIQRDTIKRVLRELHDGMGRHFVKLMRAVDDEATPRDHLRTDLRRAFTDMRLLVSSTEPTFRDLATGLATVREQYDAILEQHGMCWDWRVALDHNAAMFEPEQALNALRIVQEALTNAIKYAGATTLTVAAHAEADGSVVVSVADDGEGMPESTRGTGGVAHMRQRAEEQGMTLELDPSGRGLTLRIPNSASGS
jgi:signal transduction histidine kinase